MILTQEVVEAMSIKALVEEETFLYEQIKLVFHELNKRSMELHSSEETSLRERISIIHKKVREDPEIIERKRKRAKKLSTLSQEQLDKRLRGSTPKEAESRVDGE